MRIAVIGAGIAGALIARELCRYEAEVLLFEREPDVGWGVTKANSGIVHAGFHDEPGTLRARFCARGNAAFEALSQELSFPFVRTGAYVLAFSREEADALRRLKEQGEMNDVPGLEIVPGDEVLSREPSVNPKVIAGLWSPTVGITEPWAVAIAAVENAQVNGLDLHLGEEVTGIEVQVGRVQAVVTEKGRYPVDAVVNAAGLFADRVAEMAGIDEPKLFPRRGQYVLLDKAALGLVRSVLFPVPSGESKGILVVPTVDGGVLLGPTAEDLPPGAQEAETTAQGLSQVVEGARRLVPEVPLGLTVKSFAGLRPESPQKDFILGTTKITGFYQAAGLRSPGLTAAPAIARWLSREVIAPELSLPRKSTFNPIRVGIPRASELSMGEWEALIEHDPRWGRIVCFCNQVSEGEVVEAIHRGATTVDGVKFRTRAGFGRCQGSFCTDKILEILARELGREPVGVTLRGGESRLVWDFLRP